MSLYEFKESDAWDFARQQGIRTKQKGEELHFMYCPYCRSTKDKWTFAIDLRTGQFKCLRASCSRTGNMITLSKDFDFSLGRDIDEYYKQSKKQYRNFGNVKIESKPDAVRYLEKRGISEEVAKKYQITVCKDNNNVLVMPFFDDKGNLPFIKYRKIDYDPKKDNSKEWCEVNCKPILFGMHQCNVTNKRLIMTEGQIDSLSVTEAGIENAVSVPTGKNGFTWFPHCWDWIQQFTELVVFGDCEKGIITLLDEMKSRFPGTVKAVRQQDYKGCKDANEILMKYGKDAVRYAVNNAEIQPIRAVKELADVKAVDLFKMPKIATGIARVDNVLSGGIYFGQTVIITGKRGEGKSTLASQIVANALNAGKKIFVYSGELQDYFFKRWLNLQIAGKHEVIERTEADKTTSYYITNTTDEKISEWYRGRAYLFDNMAVEDEELTELLDIIEKAVRQYGIDLVLLDNLMSALDVGMSVDLYRAQSKFVDKLVKLAKRLNVVVILVAHPRKNKFSNDDTDEISGSADITNKVDIVMTYKRVDGMSEDVRKLSISKNRLTGRLATGEKEIMLFYDTASKRISDVNSAFTKPYAWEHYVMPEDDIEQLTIPFE